MTSHALLPAAERRAEGQALRRALPRSGHAGWAPPPGRADPVDLLRRTDAGKIPELLPERYKRMRADAFAFLRGAAAIMAADLATRPGTGLRAQACGDAHLMNFGTYASPEGTPVFDVVDFDETLPAPFEWDVKRLAASLAVTALTRGMEPRAARALARRAVGGYRRQIDALAHLSPRQAWYSRIDLDHAVGEIGDRALRRRQRQALAEVAAAHDPFAPLVEHGALALPSRPPLVYRLGRHEPVAHAAFAAYVETLAEERRVLVERYRLRDVAFKAVGVGSVGTFCALGLFATADGDSLILQAKEARPSVLAPYAGASAYADQGQRVVVGQRMLQANPDVFLGWAAAHPGGRHFYVRQLKDPRLAAIGARVADDALRFYAGLCGRTLARAHARSGDAARIAGYLGEGESFAAAVADFAMGYARQTYDDYETFCRALRDGTLEAAP